MIDVSIGQKYTSANEVIRKFSHQ